MKSDPFFVSVIIPVYNGGAFLAEAVESIQRQDYGPLEIIIVDDGSTDGTAGIAASFKGDIRYVFQSNSGPPVARNRGLSMARGNVIGFLDADDLWSENKLELQLARLADDPSVEIVLGRTQLMLRAGVVDGKPKFEVFRNPWITLSLGSAAFRKSVFDKVGLFNQSLLFDDDLDWFMQAREQSISMVIHEEVTLFCRRHEHNMTNQRELDNHYFIRMLKKSLDRRRQQNCEPATPLPRLSDFKEESIEKPDNHAEREEGN